MGLEGFLNRLGRDPRLGAVLTHRRVLPDSPGDWRPVPSDLDPVLRRALKRLGIDRLYRHQGEAWEVVRGGGNVVVSTPTASGKSLIYNLPVLDTLAREPDARALYLFPLKALEQDQAAKLGALLDAAGLAGRFGVEIYDGDTPSSRRARIRDVPPAVLITNPDMLHLSIMAYHALWEDMLRNLRYIVIDELHVYRGVFGSHMLHVLQRLVRLCRHYGVEPQVIAASATIAGAAEHAERLTGLPFRAIEVSGAPAPPRHFLFFGPSDSYLTTALYLFVGALEADLKTIVFTKARRTTELLHRWITEARPDLAGAVSSYRAGFRPEERRAIERDLQRGVLRGVISTSALELGIDIGGLDVCVLVGYPGTVAATWQRAGRVGRGSRPAAVCLVAGPDQLDQYFLRHPDDFFRRPVEGVVVDATNPYIARRHILCAAQEIPILRGDPRWGEPAYPELIRELAGEGKLLLGASGDRWFSALRRPQRQVDIRSAGDQFTILLEGSPPTPLGSVSGRAVLAECHPGAVYFHRGETYLVTAWERTAHAVVVRPFDGKYYTVALFEKDTRILQVLKERGLPAGKALLARLEVTEQLVGYQRRRNYSQELLSQHPLDYPPYRYETVGLAVAVPKSAAEVCEARGLHFRGGLHGMEHATLALAPLFALCDRNDLGGYSMVGHPQISGPAVFFYDGQPGGVGLSARLFEVLGDLLVRTRELVGQCPCEVGCPSCIHSPKCGHGNVPLDKSAALVVLDSLLVGEPAASTRDRLQQRAGGGKGVGGMEPLRGKVGLPAAWPRHRRGVVFDVETQRGAEEVGGWGNIRAMGLAWAVVYRFPEDEWMDFAESDVAELVKVLESADLVVGFNVLRFDYEVLKAYSGVDFRRLPTYDILVHLTRALGHRLRLDQVAGPTLGAVKSADGLQSLKWWRQGEVDKVARYCRKDVEITRDLFFHILNRGYLLFEKKGIGLMRIPMPGPFADAGGEVRG